MNFVPFRVRVPQEYLIGEESLGLKGFRSLIPPFIHLEVIQGDTLEPDELSVRSVFLDAGPNFNSNVMDYISSLIGDQLGQATKEFPVSDVANSIKADVDGKKLGLPLMKAMIAEIAEAEDPGYMEGIRKVYLIHPPKLENEIRCHLSALPVPAMPDSPSERLISVNVGENIRIFVVEPYKIELTRRRSTDPRWLIVHPYNPDKPALVIKVEAQGPLTFKEPTPLLLKTEYAENQAMELLQANLRDSGVTLQDLCYEPNGPKTFPDYRASVNGVPWNFEVTRVLGDVLKNRRILDKPRNAKKMIDNVVQSPPLGDEDVRTALEKAIRSKEHKRQCDGTANNLFLVLLNVLDFPIGIQSALWKEIDLSSFGAVALINNNSQPNIELIKGNYQMSSEMPKKRAEE